MQVTKHLSCWKYIKIMILALFLFLLPLFTVYEVTAEEKKDIAIDIYLDNEQLIIPDNILLLQDEYLLIHARFLFNIIGGTLDFSNRGGKLQIETLDEKHIIMEENSKTAMVNGIFVEMEAAPLFLEKEFYIPLQSTVTLSGEKFSWDKTTGKVAIFSDYEQYGKDVIWFINSLNAHTFLRPMMIPTYNPEEKTFELAEMQPSFTIIGGQARNQVSALWAQTFLSHTWDINDREDVFSTIALLYFGGHNATYINENGIEGHWGERGILAWDMCHVAQVAGYAYAGHYITLDEYVSIALPAAAVVQEYFNGWKEMSENYVYGAAYYSKESVDKPGDELKIILDAQKDFLKTYQEKCPDWDTFLINVPDVPEKLDIQTDTPQLFL